MANKQSNNNVVHIGDTITGSVNTQLQFSFETFNVVRLSMMFNSVGGNFAAQLITVEVSEDNTNWVSAGEDFNFGSTNRFTKRYVALPNDNQTTRMLDFQYVRFTIPALGSGISCVVTYGGAP